jgi:hypothetical protein
MHNKKVVKVSFVHLMVALSRLFDKRRSSFCGGIWKVLCCFSLGARNFYGAG